MAAPTKTKWHLIGEEVVSCNCAWGCPCQFNSLPTYGHCEGPGIVQIHEGHFGDISLDGVRFVATYHWPGAVHEGNGTMQLIIDEQATPAQRAAIVALNSGTQGGAYFETFAAVTPNMLDPIYAPIEFTVDRVKREATLRVSGLVECYIEPIKNPVTGEEHVARIVLPHGFEFTEADMANAVSWQATLGDKTLAHENCYAQLNSIDWSND
jgi:hypothetical protein